MEINNLSNQTTIAVVGAGLAGSIASIALARRGISVDLFESHENIFNASSAVPVHIYSGVQYFGDIDQKSITQCMYDAIAFARTLPSIIIRRPTVVAIAKEDMRKPKDLENMCKIIQKIYENECLKDPKNEVFGPPNEFYKPFYYEEVVKAKTNLKHGENPWITAFAYHTNLENLQFPIFLLNEYEMDVRQTAGFIEQMIDENKNIKVHLSTEVENIQSIADGILLHANTKTGTLQKKYHLLVDASGSQLGKFEYQLGINNQRLIDVKIAGLFKYSQKNSLSLPQIYILGGKGYPPNHSFMSHFSPFQSSIDEQVGLGVINITTTDCMYVVDGKKSNQGKGKVEISPEKTPLAYEVLTDNKSHLPRLQNMVKRFGQRHPFLAEGLNPIRGIPGCVTILGNDFLNRDSVLDVHLEQHYISINMTKGSAAVRLAKELCNRLILENKKFAFLKLQQEDDEHSWMPKNIPAALQRTHQRYLKLGIKPVNSFIKFPSKL